jgi:hypothetical protein
MDPSAQEIFRAIADGRSIEGVGTQLENTAPSEANTTVQVIDAGNAAGASKTEDVLTQAGFDVSPGVVTAAPPEGLRHTAIAYGPGQQAYANVVATYFPGLKLVETRGLASPVAIVVLRGYEPSEQPSGGSSEGPSTAQCPTDSP